MANYKTDFIPRRGDVTYGISPACSAYLSAWEAELMTRIKDPDPQVAADAFEDYEAALGGKKTNRMDCYNNYYGVPNIAEHSKKKAMKSFSDKIQSAPNDRMKAYGRGIQTSRFSPRAVFSEKKAKLRSEGYQKSNFTSASAFWKDKDKEAQALKQNMNYLAIRRACKFGIGLVATDPLFAEAKVHFILDGLDMQEVANKQTRQTQQNTGPNKVAVSITVSELRYVYRNWGKLSGKVILYVNLIPVQAPWLNNWGPLQCYGGFQDISAEKNLWDAYGAQRLQKYGATDVNEILKALI